MRLGSKQRNIRGQPIQSKRDPIFIHSCTSYWLFAVMFSYRVRVYLPGVRSLIIKLRHNVVEVTRISDRIMSVKIDADPTVLRIISCYAPQTNCPDEEKTEFWRALDDHLQTISPEEHVAVGGDLNGHVGKGRDGYHRFHGGQGFGTRNDEGCRVLDYAEAHDLAMTNTFFKKKPAHLITYSSGGRDTQIDYWLVRRPHLSLVTNVKVIPSTNIGPQHRLLVMDLRLNLGQRRRRTPTTTVEKIKWWRLPEGSNFYPFMYQLLAFCCYVLISRESLFARCQKSNNE
ncbi:uncharacterized protein LOC113017592 [Astatotilapia calliptera]|uniref:uncharacterized protein LOC113017592 n=1 Tax=Astatotilapia calliptera TaxID=8154 RepID=UPI000E42C3B4|nr:uncharacterized protein LOC113017592 [Astatotilapia calliptera]